MKLCENLLIWAVVFLPATIWWIRASFHEYKVGKSWADIIACTIMCLISIGMVGTAVVLFIAVCSGGQFVFIF